MGQRIHIPVGVKITSRDLQGLSIQDLEQRSLYDPAYERPFDSNFRWADHIQLDPGLDRDPALKAKIIGSLEQFSRTVEGQQVIRQAHAMQYFRNHDRPYPAHLTPPDSRIRIALPDPGDPGSSFDIKDGTIRMHAWEIYNAEYRGANGIYQDMSVQHTLFHELTHAMDGLNKKDNGAVFNRYRATVLHLPIPKAGDDPVVEVPSMIATNYFMRAYYNEPESDLSHQGRVESSPAITTQPNLGPDHYYNDFEVPSVPRGDSGTRYR